MNRFRLCAVAAGLLALFTLSLSPAVWAANSITGITPGANRTMLVDGKATVRFMVSGQRNEDADCGISVQYGDQDSPDTRSINRQDGLFPREFVHTFVRPGQYTVTARGERVKQSFGCGGEASTSIIIDEPARRGGGYRRVAAACPDGWQLSEDSSNRDTGAFTCAPVYPPQRISCGPGLRYFERDNLIGCRARGNNQR